jgi:hypothetical protein
MNITDQNQWPVPQPFSGMKELMLRSLAAPKTQALL